MENHILTEQSFHLLAREGLLWGNRHERRGPMSAQADWRGVSLRFNIEETHFAF